ncbi:hypothetical protein PT974_10727 [Cladobotryum mycophilum]|uniref:Uncharacterized protein n=1 Tax=Cladobotryum mycophilum TaxID=491253 RepID=A0ABR0SB97_9HYPO
MGMVESWVGEQGFDTPLTLVLEENQANELNGRVHKAVEEVVTRAEGKLVDDDDDDDDEYEKEEEFEILRNLESYEGSFA